MTAGFRTHCDGAVPEEEGTLVFIGCQGSGGGKQDYNGGLRRSIPITPQATSVSPTAVDAKR